VEAKDRTFDAHRGQEKFSLPAKTFRVTFTKH
jgi:hypothetical protein